MAMKFTEETILHYLDGELSQKERQLFEEELQANSTFAALFARHQLLHERLAGQKLAVPSAGFTEKVMAAVSTATIADPGFFNRTRRFVLLLIFLALGSGIFYSWVQFYPTLGAFVGNQLTVRDFTLNLQPAQQLLGSELLFKALLYANGLISLLLFDRAILRPYFTHRRQRQAM